MHLRTRLKKYYLLGLLPLAMCFWGAVNGLSLPDSSYDFGRVKYGRVLHHRFVIKNRSMLPIVLGSAMPACECTDAELKSHNIAPFGKAYLDVTFHTKGFHGKATRFIAVEVVKPFKRELTLTFDVDVTGAPESGLEKILFSHPCSDCHVTPGVGKMGKELYDSVCLMCHTEGKGAPPISTGAWTPKHTEITRRGIPGSSMPGFSIKVGGKLSEQQIKSIECYFSTH